MLWKIFNVFPLVLALAVSCCGAALAQDAAILTANVPPWLAILSSQGLAVALVVWWVAVGYPSWLRAIDRQRSEDRASIKDYLMETNAKQERICETLTEVRDNLLQRPCQLPPRK